MVILSSFITSSTCQGQISIEAIPDPPDLPVFWTPKNLELVEGIQLWEPSLGRKFIWMNNYILHVFLANKNSFGILMRGMNETSSSSEATLRMIYSNLFDFDSLTGQLI